MSRPTPLLFLVGAVVWIAAACLQPAWADERGTLGLSAEENRFLDEHPVLRVAAMSNIPPFQEVRLEDGRWRYVGLAVEYLGVLEKSLGVAFEPVFGQSLARYLEMAQSGGIDLFAGLIATPERQAFLHFTKPYLVQPYVLVTRADDRTIDGLQNLEGKTLALAPTYYGYERLQREPVGKKIRFLFVADGPAALAAVEGKSADATVLSLALATAAMAQYGYDDLRVATPVPWEPCRIGMASPHAVLAGILQKALATIPQETREALAAKAYTLRRPDRTPATSSGRLVLAACAAVPLGLLLLWVGRRCRAVWQRTRDLRLELAAKCHLLDEVANATGDVIIVLDAALDIRLINRAGTERFGREMTGAPGRSLLDSISPQPAAGQGDPFRQVLATGEPLRFTDNRAGRTYDTIIFPAADIGGGRPGLAVCSRDVTEQQAAETALRESQTRLGKIFRLLPVMVSISSATDGRILEVNDAFTDTFGYERAEALGRTAAELGIWLRPTDRDDIAAAINAQGMLRGYEVPLRHKDGHVFTLLLAAFPLEAFGQPCLLSVGVDISGRKSMEEALRLAKESAETANRAKSQFLSTMSHEIRTPMNTILGMVDVLRATRLTDRQQEFLQTLELAGEALMALLTDILELSRIESGTLEMACVSFDPAEVARQAMEMLRPQAERKQLVLTSRVDRDLPARIQGDPAKLRQILVNLLGNAIKFTDRGEIRLEVRLLPGQAGRDEILYVVADTGIGIDPERQQAIFEPFIQADASTTRAYGGSGLGLAISAMLAKGMSGRLWVESRPGEGSTFSCALPLDLHVRPAQAIPDLWRQPPAPRSDAGSPRSLLVVEDSASNRNLYQLFLEDRPLSLTFAETGEQALALCAARAFDAILIDLHLPGMDGLAVIRELRRREAAAGRAATPILVVTAQAFREESGPAFEAGCDALLTKPVQKGRLIEILDRLLARTAPAKDAAGPDAWTTTALAG